MTLEELLENTPEQWRPLVAQYGPALVRMTAQEFCAWLELLIAGDVYEACRAVFAGLGEDELLAKWQSVAAKWDDANARNAEQMALQKQAALAVLRVLLAAALAAVGL